MRTLDEMISDISSIYTRYLKKDRGIEYVFARLWEDYDDDAPDEEMVTYNLIIAKKNVLEEIVTKNNWNCINRAIMHYKVNKSKIKVCFSDEDYRDIEQMYSEIIEIKSLKD